jgi:hypothetical protein
MMEELLPLIAPAFQAYLAGPPLYLLLGLLGIGIGVLTGFFGVGGGFLVVPLLTVLLGIPYEIATGTSLSFVIGTSSSGFLRQAKLGRVEYRVMAWIAAGSIAGSVAGDALQIYLRTGITAGRPELFTAVMHSLFILLLAGAVLLLLWGPQERRGGRTPLQRLSLGPAVRMDEPGLEGTSAGGLLLLGVGVGLLTGLMGVGGGVIVVPLLLVLVGLPADKAAGTSLGIVCLAAIAGVVKKTLGADPRVSLPVAAALLVASVMGVRIGIALLQGVSGGSFRRAFAVVLVLGILLIAGDLLLF